MKEKIILTDADGVLFDWIFSFDQWMKKHGYEKICDKKYCMAESYGLEKFQIRRLIRIFNESAMIRKLPPLRDAIKYVKKLHEDHGYVFHVITSLSSEEYSQHLRTKNLCEMFGDSVFARYVYLDTGADKDDALKEYESSGCFWIEDKVENCELGVSLGLNSILMAHDYNANQTPEGAIRTQNWKEIYSVVTGQS